MIRKAKTRNRLSSGIPRESGDDPSKSIVDSIKGIVFPARAGMILLVHGWGRLSLSIPRESGDDPPTMTLYDLVYAYSPRERG